MTAKMLAVRSIDYEPQKREKTLRSVSFKKLILDKTDNFDGLDKVVVEEPLRSTKRKIEELKLQTSVSSKNLVLDVGNSEDEKNGDVSIKESKSRMALSKHENSIPPMPSSELVAAVIKLQKVYKSYRTRRNLADSAVVAEELWWKALDSAALRKSSVSFFDSVESETAVSRWARARTRAAKLGKGLSKDEKAQQLALRHWLEAIDPRHRYGHNLHLYYDVWFGSESSQPFFYWLDIGDGKEVNLEKCSRTDLQHQCITYLGPKERDTYEVKVDNGKLVYKQSGVVVDTDAAAGGKWIFVLSTMRKMYVGEKKKGLFQHSSFVSGGAVIAAGRFVATNGVLEAIWSYSGHYRPNEESFSEVLSFLEEQQIALTDVKKFPIDDDVPPNKKEKKMKKYESMLKGSKAADDEKEVIAITKDEKKHNESNEVEVEVEVEAPKFELGECVSCKWTTGAGPRIGCLREYPAQLQSQALQQLNLSPRISASTINNAPIPSPRPSTNFHLSPRLARIGLSTPLLQNLCDK